MYVCVQPTQKVRKIFQESRLGDFKENLETCLVDSCWNLHRVRNAILLIHDVLKIALLLQSDFMLIYLYMNTYDWYQALEKPFFAPPSYVFGFVWGILYVLIFVAFILLVFEVYKKRVSKELIYIFILNMIGNLMFTPVQFGLKNNFLAFLVIMYVVATLIIFQKKIKGLSKTIYYLMLPYLIWVSFAAILQLTITVMNI